MKIIYAMLVFAGPLVFSSCNESRRGNDSNLNETRNEAAAEANTDKFEGKTKRDAEFVYEAVGRNYGEIKMAELANQKSRSDEVKRIAQELITDHTTSLNELKTLAQAKAISVPVEETDAARRKLENMAEESEKDFDEEWSDEMLKLHERSIDMFEDRLKGTEDAALKAFINKTLPVLKEHYQHLKALNERLKKKNS
jgi:putative membrane protein